SSPPISALCPYTTLFRSDEPLEREVTGVDDDDGRVRAFGQIVLGAIRIDPADVERPQWVARDLNRGQASSVCIGWCAWAGASSERGAGYCQQHGREQRCREDRDEHCRL